MDVPWAIGDVAVWVEKGQDQHIREIGSNKPTRTIKGRTTRWAVRIVELLGQIGFEHSAEVEYLDIDNAGPRVVALVTLECDPELTLKHASDWRDAGGRDRDTP